MDVHQYIAKSDAQHALESEIGEHIREAMDAMVAKAAVPGDEIPLIDDDARQEASENAAAAIVEALIVDGKASRNLARWFEVNGVTLVGSDVAAVEPDADDDDSEDVDEGRPVEAALSDPGLVSYATAASALSCKARDLDIRATTCARMAAMQRRCSRTDPQLGPGWALWLDAEAVNLDEMTEFLRSQAAKFRLRVAEIEQVVKSKFGVDLTGKSIGGEDNGN